ncbi:fatty acid desaturase [uncultured Aquitalea sp.]|uniref:fatty acid desaturase n=1 Tax=uncultured Aquitalea sp. TaxID=540272 RepID=UPI0025DB0857|nr:fatty acid desaturase [uncultured Aquitalea sp.]
MTLSRQSARLNLLLTALSLRLAFAELVAVPLAVGWFDPRCALPLIAIALFAPLRWQLLHEAAHGLLLPQRGRNDLSGRVMGVCFLVPFDLWRLAHRWHHVAGRSRCGKVDVYEPGPWQRWRCRLALWLRLLGGAYAMAVLAGLACLLPACWLRRRGLPKGLRLALRHGRRARRLRWDAGAGAALYGLAAWLYGDAFWMLALAVAARALLVSLGDQPCFAGQGLGDPSLAANLSLPRCLGPALLNAHLRGMHHRRPDLGWQSLPEAFARGASCWDGRYWQAVWRRQWRAHPAPSLPVIPLRKAGPTGIMPADFITTRHHDPAQERHLPARAPEGAG